ncbi:MAG: hypothetical protein KF784_00395 [Fimbriimonadaceae bacterium]|nr:hypothetical protein [Fimbriimonadaceae bacterium]
MRYDADALMKLLPEFYSVADLNDWLLEQSRTAENAEQIEQNLRGPLWHLLEVLAGPTSQIDEQNRQLYDDQFIETCTEWVVAYIGDLVGASVLHPTGEDSSLRGWVANTLASRRRKGTVPALRQVAKDSSAFPAEAVEMFQKVGWTQNQNHIRPGHQWIDIRNANKLDFLGGPFTPGTHTVDIRNIRIPRGKYAVPNMGVFVWRWRDFPIQTVTAKDAGMAGAYTFSPLGIDAPIFNTPESVTDRYSPKSMDETKLPVPIRRRALHDDLEAMRQADVVGEDYTSSYFGDENVIVIRERGQAPIPTDEIYVCNLEAWGVPPNARTYTKPDGSTENRPVRVGVDPMNGRIRFVPGQEPTEDVLVDFSYGFWGAIGGGPYDRTDSLDEIWPDEVEWFRRVRREGGPGFVTSLAQAITDWNAGGADLDGVITIEDCETYDEALDEIEAHEGSHLLILAGKWLGTDPVPPFASWTASAQGPRPHILGDMSIKGTAAANSNRPGFVGVSGLLIEGDLTVSAGNCGGLTLADCTIDPRTHKLEIKSTNAGDNRNLQLRASRCILGSTLIASAAEIAVFEDAIVDGNIVGPRAEVTLNRTTTTGKVEVEVIDASDTLFVGVLDPKRLQKGCVRFSYLSEGSRAPRAYRCQPELAIKNRTTETEASIRARMMPSFVSTVYGHPGYMQPSIACSPEILTGAENGDCMGATNIVRHSLREANLRFAIGEYLRAGMDAGIFISDQERTP